jgi:cyclomaltodextrinase
MTRRPRAVLIALCLLAFAASAGGASPLKQVTFTFLTDRQFSSVYLAGTFNEWNTDVTRMRPVEGGYEVTLPLAVGEYQYKFVADGQWITDETASRFHPDGFGGRNSVVEVDERFPDLVLERGDGRILTDGLGHGQSAWERSLNDDGTVTLRVRTWAGDVAVVELELGADPPPHRPMHRYDSDGTFDYYSTRVGAELIELYPQYRFRFSDGDRVLWLGRNGVSDDAAQVVWFDFDLEKLAAFATPEWVQTAVIYQIFPERFANGDPSNDPDFSEWYYEGVSTLPPSGKTNGEYFHLIRDWYDVDGLVRSPYRTDGKPDWNSFYGGDIEGVRRNLDYLVDLGATAVYFNPVFTAKSNHKYDAASYMEVDPHFASNDEFKRFVEECHERGVRVILDLAINHTGHTYWAFVDAREKGPESQYWDWYEWKDWPVPGEKQSTPPDPLDYYDCWWGFGQMPNLNFDLGRPSAEEHVVVDIAEATPNWPLVNHLLDVAAYWLTEIGVDGYRLDVAGEIPFWFWDLFRERVKSTKPDAYIVGELWGSSPDWVNASCFDAVMNYKYFRDPVLSFVARGDATAEEFDRALAPGRLIYPDEGVRAMMNLLGSHDTERFLTTAGGDARRLKLAALFAMTYVGAPTIYYGDEVAMEGGHDPDCRRPFYWKWSEEAARVDVHDYFALLAAARRAHPSCVWGDFETLLAEGRTYAYRRVSTHDEITVVMNASAEPASVTVPVGEAWYEATVALAPEGASGASVVLANLLGGPDAAVEALPDGHAFRVEIPPLTGYAFEVSYRPGE